MAKKAAVLEKKEEAAPAAKPVDSLSFLAGRVDELEGDLRRIVELLVKGDLDSAKFREILDKKQGK